MNRFTVKAILVAICLLLPVMAYSLPGPHDPMTGKNNIMCETCHTGTATPLNTLANVCTGCHNGTNQTTDGSARTIQPFTATDYADPYNASDPRTNPYQTSHKWAGSDVQPKAGALAPTDPYQTTTKGMNKRGLTGSVTCARCHNIHGLSGSQSESFPYLRSPNDNDQMCLDCHRTRNHSDQSFGTHPVNVSLKAAWTANPLKYYSSPVNANVSNSTSGLKIINNKVQCSTCHQVHYADSKSGTTHDRYNFNKLSTSRGGLLRTDVYGATATSLNVCTNCHKGDNHNVGGQNIQCNDCHTGHVDYVSPADIIANPKEATPNKYMLRRYVNISTSADGSTFTRLTGPNAYRKKMVYWNSSGWANSSGNGVCQACHKLPSTVTEHSDLTTYNNAAKCMTCHTGGPHSITPPSGCTGCHGSPPVHNTPGLNKTMGFAVGTNNTYRYDSTTPNVFKNESTAGHPTHADSRSGRYAYSCDQCHKGNRDAGTGSGTNHDAYSNAAGAFQWVFVQSGVIANTGTSLAPAVTTTYTGASGTCSNVYCHSNGISRAGLTAKQYKTVTWTNSNNTLIGNPNRCIACHNGVFSTFNAMSSNSHGKHALTAASGLGKGYTCNLCHSATITSTDNTTISSTSKHADGTADVSMSGTFGGTLTVNGSWTTATATCSTSYCHSDGKGNYPVSAVTWTNRASGACGTCHAATSPMIATNRHFSHISTASASVTAAWGPGLSGAANVLCASCHTYTTELASTHVDGILTAQATAKCATTCHRNTAPTWTSATRLLCQTCHDGTISYDNRPGFNNISAPRKSFSTFNTLGHGTGQNPSYYCTTCHDNTSAHISGIRNDTNRLGVYENNENGLCNSCHTDPAKVTVAARRDLPSHVTAHDAVPNSKCSTCHDVHGTGNYASLVSSITYKATSSAVVITKPTTKTGFINTTTKRGLCQVCHTLTNHYRRGVVEPVKGFSGTGTDHATFTSTTDCLSCHKHAGPFAFSASGGDCSGCHGYPPLPKGYSKGVGNYNSGSFEHFSGAGGSHIVAGHVPKSADPAKAWDLCNSCHSIGDHNTGGDVTKAVQIKTTVSSRLRMNPAVLAKYTSNRLDGAAHTVGTCTNVSCHFQRSPKWGNKP